MKAIEKIAKSDKGNFITKKDGSLKKRTIEAIKFSANSNNRFYTDYYLGSGRYTTTGSYYNEINQIVKILGYKFKKGNDAPRGGVTGNYIQVSSRAFNTIINLI